VDTTARAASAADIHARLGAAWPSVLARLGIPEERLRKRGGPCPACGGRDRFTFDNRHLRGDFFCRHCGAGDGFALLQRVHGWDFRQALHRVAEAVGLSGERRAMPVARPPRDPPARPTQRVREILRGACEPADVADVREYLKGRDLWPLPHGCTLRAHASVDYWNERQRVGRFAALIAEVRDGAGELVTLHVTYLAAGRKLEQHAPRKLFSALTGHSGCAARLLPIAGDVLGVAEGLETAIAAQKLHDVPTWAALNAGLLAKFEPPPAVRTLIIFADRDVAGLEAVTRLMERLQNRLHVEVRVPPEHAKDWAEVLADSPPW
jgi:putative DNA primase/helicase